MFDRNKKYPACQSIRNPAGEILFDGEWDGKSIFEVSSSIHGSEFWEGKKVLTIAANTSGLCVELARAGAQVTACEPDPHKNNRSLVRHLLAELVEEESLSLTFLDVDFFSTHKLAKSKRFSFWKPPILTEDTIIICYGLIYHFRDIVYAIEYLSSLPHAELFISTQTQPGNNLAIFNRVDPEVLANPGFWDNYSDTVSGWHFTRKLFEAYLESAGYKDIRPLTDASINFPQKPKGLTNSAYYTASHVRQNDFKERLTQYHPR
ncbi:MAG: hypothetical protein CMD74_02070 [Gammaproteobacteria bacterium]|nr:hypothetical protein [Gammaproteobacteria bacterium]